MKKVLYYLLMTLTLLVPTHGTLNTSLESSSMHRYRLMYLNFKVEYDEIFEFERSWYFARTIFYSNRIGIV